MKRRLLYRESLVPDVSFFFFLPSLSLSLFYSLHSTSMFSFRCSLCARLLLLARGTIFIYRWKERRVKARAVTSPLYARRSFPFPALHVVAARHHPLLLLFLRKVLVLVIVVFVVALPVASLLALFTVQRSRASPSSRWTHGTRKRRIRRWKATGFFHTQTSVINSRRAPSRLRFAYERVSKREGDKRENK